MEVTLMTLADRTHPTVEQLRAFACGELHDDSSEEIEQHLSGCTLCCELLDAEPEDSLAALFRTVGSLSTSVELSTAPTARMRQRGMAGYELMEVLGQGGMGVVWKARHDGLNRLVALKRLRSADATSAEALARFCREAESIARLRHPNIVQIYDIGEHDGEPYLALEYVNGGSLAERLASGPLPTEQAAMLVETLARAIHHAHEHGILHRDLKPGNVMLSEDGSPKISDFGLAKQLDSATAHTQTGAILGTPSYMAPEQASSGEMAVGPAADVYALGAILYETLTGRPPFRGPTVLDTLAQVREREPVPPRQLQPTVPHDLQTICLKCLHKEPQRRYGSAFELAEDLRRFHASEPVHARPVGRVERLHKWVRRKPHLALLAVVFCLIPLAAIAGLLWHNDKLQKETNRAQTAEQDAEDNYAKARQTLLSIVDRFESWTQSGKSTSQLHEGIVQDSLAYIETALDKSDKNDPRVRCDAAQLLGSIGRIQGHYGRHDAARANFVKASTLWEQLSREHPEETSYRRELANCYRSLAFWGDEQQRLEWIKKAVQMAEELYRLGPGDNAGHNIMLLGQCHHDLACTLHARNPSIEAEENYRQAIRLFTRMLEGFPEHDGCRLGLADSHCNLGLLYLSTHRLELAESALRRADALLEPLMTRMVLARTSRSAVALNWGNLYLELGQIDKALASYDRGIEWCEAVLRSEANFTPARDRVWKLHGARAQVFDSQKRYAEAAVEWERAVKWAEGSMRLQLRMYRCISLARSGDSARAAAEADVLAAEPACPPDSLYNCACVVALSGRAEKAVALLIKLRNNGYFDDANRLKNLRTDPDFDSLRRRDDFLKLLNEAAKPAALK